jgi:hypothetical protein
MGATGIRTGTTIGIATDAEENRRARPGHLVALFLFLRPPFSGTALQEREVSKTQRPNVSFVGPVCLTGYRRNIHRSFDRILLKIADSGRHRAVRSANW